MHIESIKMTYIIQTDTFFCHISEPADTWRRCDMDVFGSRHLPLVACQVPMCDPKQSWRCGPKYYPSCFCWVRCCQVCYFCANDWRMSWIIMNLWCPCWIPNWDLHNNIGGPVIRPSSNGRSVSRCICGWSNSDSDTERRFGVVGGDGTQRISTQILCLGWCNGWSTSQWGRQMTIKKVS